MTYKELYLENGWFVINSLFSDSEVDEMNSTAEELYQKKKEFGHFRNQAFGKRVFEKFDPISSLSTLFENIVNSSRIVSIVESVIGGECVLYKDKLIYKQPGDMGYALHQDFSWWQNDLIDGKTTLSVYISLDDSNAENGAIELSEINIEKLITPVGESRNLNSQESIVFNNNMRLIETKKGDAIFFSSLLPHRSGPNLTNKSRKALYPTFTTHSNEQ